MAQFPPQRSDASQLLQSGPASGRSESLPESDLRRVVSTLAAQGIESGELVLDLILHDVAEQARQATGASGAAIALARDGQMVCRAAAGPTAPDLGARINTESGLSGACVREERTQWCKDTETDWRVDPGACRQLGVRSIVVVPLFLRDQLAGVLEIFSPQPNAFAEGDLRKLLDLIPRITEAMAGGAAKKLAEPEVPPVITAMREPEPEPELEPKPELTAAADATEIVDETVVHSSAFSVLSACSVSMFGSGTREHRT